MPEEKELIFKEEPDLPEEDTVIDEEPVANTGRKVKIDWFENNIWHGKTGYVIWEDPTDDSDLATVTVNITDFPSEDGLKEVEQNFERRRVVDYSEDEPVEVPEEKVEIEEPIPEEQPVKESLKEDNENTPTTYFLDCSGSFRSNPDHNWPQEMREIKNSSGNAKVFYFASFIHDNEDDAKMDGGSQGYFKIIDYAKKHPEEKCIVRTDDDYKTLGADELEALPNVELRITLEPRHEEQPVKESLKEEAMYGLFVEVKNSDTDDIIEAKRKLMVGTKKECEDEKKHLEEVSNGVGNHINNYTVEFLGNSSYDNPSNPDKVITSANTVYYIAGESTPRLGRRLLYVKDPKYDETLKVRYGAGFGFDDAVLYFLSEKEAQEFLNAIKAGNFENADKLTGVRAIKPAEGTKFAIIKTDFGIAAVKSDKMIGQKQEWEDHIAKLFDLDVKEDLEEEHECCICHKKFKGFGNNAEPVCDGICCDDCNWRVVIPARVKEYKAGPSDIDFDDEMFEDCENCREHTAIPDDDDVDFTW